MSAQAELIHHCIQEIQKLRVKIELEDLRGNPQGKKVLEELLAEKQEQLEAIKGAN